MTASDFIALAAVGISLYSLYWTRKIAITIAERNENKILLDELLYTIKEMDSLASHFFLTDRKERLDTHHYSASFVSKSRIAQYLAYTLKEDKAILSDSIDKPLSDLHKFATLNTEKINSNSVAENLSQYSNVNTAYLNCVQIIHQTFQAKYQ